MSGIPPSPASGRNPAFDRLRGIGAVMVVFIHAPPLLHSNVPVLQDAGWLIRELCQLAVPYFFLLSGWMMGRKWVSGRTGWDELGRSLGRLASLYLPWFLLFLAFDAIFGLPHSPLLVLRRFAGFSVTGPKTTGYHLWFLPSLALAQVLVWAGRKSTGSSIPALVVGAALFACFYVREILGLDAPFGMVATEGLNLSLVLVALGSWLGSRPSILTPGPWMVVVSVALLLAEGIVLQRLAPGKEPVHTFQVLRIVSGAILLLWAARSPGGMGMGMIGRFLDFLGRYSTAIYVSHLAFLVLIPFDRWVPNGFVRDNLVRWPVALVGACALSFLLGRSRWPAIRRLVA